MPVRTGIVALSVFLLSCSRVGPPPATPARAPRQPTPAAEGAPVTCGDGAKLRVHFYDVGQGLAVLVDLPDRHEVLVDAGNKADRRGCGSSCAEAHRHLLDALARDLGAKAIDLLWITHPHSDHIGGAADVLARFRVVHYVDNGVVPAEAAGAAEVRAARDAARRDGAKLSEVGPGRLDVPLDDGPHVTLHAVTPPAWPVDCAKAHADQNLCSIGLRIDYCASSVLFTGDMERRDEARLTNEAVTLLQLGHHGSETSSTQAFLDELKPKYAVISAGKPDEGLNETYCHPRASTVARLTAVLGGPGSTTIRAFDSKGGAVRCRAGLAESWVDVPASDRLWATERDGDVVLVTTGDGSFVRK